MYLLRILLLENLGRISNLLSGLDEDGFKIFIALNDEGHESQGKEESAEAGENSGSETGSEKEEGNDTEETNEIEAELTKSLSKQRQRAIASARRGRKTLASRNNYKDKGGRSSQSSKVQMSG
ncbi:serine/threonine-protein kinase RIO2-like protein, partial [Trifolium pratense]